MAVHCYNDSNTNTVVPISHYYYYKQSFNFISTVLPEISVDEKKHELITKIIT